MKATYSPSKQGKKLNVREQPRSDAAVVRTMEAGTVETHEVANGWVKLEDGYADARFMTVTDGDGEPEKADAPEPEDVDEKVSEPEAVEDKETEPEEAEGTDGDEDARKRLKKMTNPQLYKLAEDSGIKVAKGSTKAELIDAILNGADE